MMRDGTTEQHAHTHARSQLQYLIDDILEINKYRYYTVSK